MKKTGFFVAVTGALACVSLGVHASLSSVATLTFDSVDPNAPVSYFEMNSIKTPLDSFEGIVLGTTQPASGSHSGSPDGSESPSIDDAWFFFFNTGLSQTTSNVTIISDDGNGNVELDFSGWNVTWNGIPSIPMGSGAFAGNPEGTAIVTCGNTCENGDNYVLDYSATVPVGDPSGFGGVPYALHLEGTIVVTGQLPTNAKLNFGTSVTGQEKSQFVLGDPATAPATPIGSFDGIILGTTQSATGSHAGAPDGSESPGIDNAWEFPIPGNTGMSQTTGTPVTVINQDDPSNVTLDFAGWGVTWNGIDNIALGSGAFAGNPEGTAIMSCANACEEGDTYTLDYSATVADGGFAGAPYSLHLAGTIGVAGPPPTAPVTKPDSVRTKPNDSVLIDVLKNDSSPDGLDCTSVAVVTNPGNGTATVDTDAGSADCGSITYLPNVDFKGTDTFEYTVASDLGATSDPTEVTVKVKKKDNGSSGCTMSANNSPHQGEWWLLAGFVAWLGWKQHNQRNRKTH